MIKKICFLFFFSFLFYTSAKSQDKFYFNNIPVVFNVDSVNNVAKKHNISTGDLLYTLLCLEKSKRAYRLYSFGEKLPQIDSLCKVVNDKYATANYFILYGIFMAYSNQLKCIEAHTKALEILEKSNDIEGFMYTISINIENYLFYFIINNDSLIYAKKQVQNLLQIQEKILSKYNTTWNKYVFTMSRFFIDLMQGNDFKKMEDAIKKSEQLLDEMKIYNHNKFYLYHMHGVLMAKQNKFYEAINYYKKLESIKAPKETEYVYYGKYYIGECYFKLNKFDSAEKYSMDALEILNKNNPTDILNFVECLSNLYVAKKANKKFAEACAVLEKKDSLSNVISNKEYKTKSFELQEKYRADEKETKNIILEKDKKQYKIIAIAALVILTLIALLLQKINKANKKLQQHDIFQEKILSIISHDLRSPLFALQGLNDQASYLLKHNKVNEFMPMATAIDDTSNKILNLLNNLLMWAVSQKNSNKKVVITKLNISECVNATLDLFNNIIQSKQINIVKNIDENAIINGNKNVLELILRNWIDNTLKYATSNHIYINATQQATHTIIEIIDDGMIDATNEKLIQNQLQQHNNITIENNTGLGLGLIHYFSKQANWQVKLTVLQNKNTFSITIPA